MTETAKHIGFQTSKQKEEEAAVPEKKKKENPELIEAMELLLHHFQPCAEGDANAYKSTKDFLRQIENYTTVWEHEMNQLLKEMGFVKTFVPGSGIVWCVKINEE